MRARRILRPVAGALAGARLRAARSRGAMRSGVNYITASCLICGNYGLDGAFVVLPSSFERGRGHD